MRNQQKPNEMEFTSEGERLVGNLFLPSSRTDGEKLPALVVGGSWITVKEQMANLYAERLAEQGFAALAFDFRGYGKSGGEPRQYESVKNKTQDFKNALTFLQSQPIVDPERIGGLAICASAGYMARAVAEDNRFKSFVTIAGWFQHPDTTPAFYGGAEGVKRRVDLGVAAMNKFQSGGQMDYVPAYDPKDENAAMFFELDYYADPKRGAIPEWKNQFAVASWSEWLQWNAIDGVAERITAPVLFIHSDNSALPDNVRRFHSLVKGSKDLYWSSEGTQIDYYDQEPYVTKAAQVAAAHFRATLMSDTDAERRKNFETVEAFFARLEAIDIEGFIALWDENGVQEMPFSPEGFPKELRGKAAIQNQYGSLPQNYASMKFPRTIHATTNPEIFVVEYQGVIDVKATGKPYNNDYVGIFNVKNGKVLKFVERFNPIILQEAFGESLQRNFNVKES